MEFYNIHLSFLVKRIPIFLYKQNFIMLVDKIYEENKITESKS